MLSESRKELRERGRTDEDVAVLPVVVSNGEEAKRANDGELEAVRFDKRADRGRAGRTTHTSASTTASSSTSVRSASAAAALVVANFVSLLATSDSSVATFFPSCSFSSSSRAMASRWAFSVGTLSGRWAATFWVSNCRVRAVRADERASSAVEYRAHRGGRRVVCRARRRELCRRRRGARGRLVSDRRRRDW